MALLVTNPRTTRETLVQFLGWKICWRRDRPPTPVFLGLLGGSAGRESACNAGDLGSIPGLGRCPGEGKGHPLQYSGLEKSMDCIVHGVTKSQTRLSAFHFHFDPLLLFPKSLKLYRSSSVSATQWSSASSDLF